MTIRRLAMAVGMVLSGCSVLVGDAGHIAVPTGAPAPPFGQACPAALMEGRLTPDDRWGVVLDGEFGPQPVRWPHGYYAERLPELVLRDAGGDLVAAEGETVYVGWGMDPDNVMFVACGHVSTDPP